MNKNIFWGHQIFYHFLSFYRPTNRPTHFLGTKITLSTLFCDVRLSKATSLEWLLTTTVPVNNSSMNIKNAIPPKFQVVFVVSAANNSTSKRFHFFFNCYWMKNGLSLLGTMAECLVFLPILRSSFFTSRGLNMINMPSAREFRNCEKVYWEDALKSW